MLVVLLFIGCRKNKDADESFRIAPTGSIVVPASWTACTSDTECVIVSLGCCEDLPVNRPHEASARRALDESGRERCSVKSACAPTQSGTWDAEPGACKAGMCRMP